MEITKNVFMLSLILASLVLFLGERQTIIKSVPIELIIFAFVSYIVLVSYHVCKIFDAVHPDYYHTVINIEKEK